MLEGEQYLNPTTLAHDLKLPWRRGSGGELLTWEEFWTWLESKYWKERCKLTPTRSESERKRDGSLQDSFSCNESSLQKKAS